MTEQEFEKLYKDAYKAVYWTAISLLKNKEETEDVVQDTFITAYNSYDSLKDKDKAVAWVKKIAANKCLNILTRRKTFNVEDEFFDEAEAVGEDFLPESLVESEEKRRILMDIIKKCLSEDTFIIVVLFYFNDLSAAEISERLGISTDSVFSRLKFARNKIKKEVEKYEDDNNDKLFAMGVPFLKLLFENESESVPFRPMPTALQNIPASHTGGAAEAAAATAKGGNAIMIKKILIGALAVSLAGGSGLIIYKANKEEEKKEHQLYLRAVEESDTSEEEDGHEVYQPANSEEDIDNDVILTPDNIDKTGAYYINEYQYSYYDDTEKLISTALYVPEYGKISETKFSSVEGADTYTWSDFNKDKKQVRFWIKRESTDTYTCSETVKDEDGIYETISYDMNNGKTIMYTTTQIYDSDGRILSLTDTEPDGTISNSVTYVYAADGSCEWTMENDSSISHSWQDPQGNLIKAENNQIKSGHVSLHLYFYDDEGKKTREKCYDDGELNHYNEFSYEGSWDGSYTKVVSYSADGSPSFEKRYEKVPYTEAQ